MQRMSPYHVKVAAEAFAAGLFAHAGYNILVQYGADQPEYDLVVSKGEKLAKISVKGSQEGKWGVCQRYLQGANYAEAIRQWLSRHGKTTLLCFIQFQGVKLGKCPRAYLATPQEVAERLRTTCMGRGATILYEDHIWSSRGAAAGQRERVPPTWRFSRKRLKTLIG